MCKDLKLKDIVTLPNGDKGSVVGIFEHGYITLNERTNKFVIFITDDCVIKPKFYHYSIHCRDEFILCDKLNELTNQDVNIEREIVNIVGDKGNFYIIYREETCDSKMTRLGERIEGIFDKFF